MYYSVFSALACLTICHCVTGNDEKKRDACDVLKQLLESSAVSVELRKDGFHRELVTSVELRSDELTGLRVVLVHRWPKGVYIDPYQVSSLDQKDWQILIDSAIDLELPAHKSSGFVTYTYPALDESTPRRLTQTIPVHARYHKPSLDGETFTSVDIQPPELLLRTEQCTHLDSSESHMVIDAPCTSENSSTCAWLRLHQQQDQISVTLQVPVGDGSLVIPVSAGTLLVTMICCVALSKYIWKHRFKH